jgi:hypothetical protein
MTALYGWTAEDRRRNEEFNAKLTEWGEEASGDA